MDETLVEDKWPAVSQGDGLRFAESLPVLRSFLRAMGHDPRDYEVQQDRDSQLCQMLGLQDRLITVRRWSTGEERIYTVTAHSSWLAELLHDVELGYFGPMP